MNKAITIAYVEDEPSIAQLLSSGLSLFGITVHPLYMSAEKLLENRENPDFQSADMLMCDIRLPRMTGLELAAELRATGETRPLVLVSAWPRPDEEKLQAIKANFLPKPFDFADVVRTIQELTANK